MKTDRRALCGGIVLLAAIPALLFWQSSNESKGTGPGKSKYNEYHVVSQLTMHLYNDRPEALHLFCRYTLGKYGNGSYTAAWIDYVSSRCGECADVHLARAWLFNFMRNAAAMNREFAAARSAARDRDELDRINGMIDQVMR